MKSGRSTLFNLQNDRSFALAALEAELRMAKVPFWNTPKKKEDLKMTTVDAKFVGVDTNRDLIEASVRPIGQTWRFESGESGMTELADRLSFIRPELVVLEANGNFELPLAGMFATAGLPFAFVQPRMVRDFARAIGRIARSGEGYSGLLAHFAELVRPKAAPLSDEVVQQLRDLRTRREEVVQMIGLERERSATAPQIVQKDIQQHIHCLMRSVSGIDDQFSRLIRMNRIWR
jgi:transposase